MSNPDTSFYLALENRFRGSRELILGRLQVYQPYLSALRSWQPNPTAIDLGCGRGEWLSVLSDNGFRAVGVDVDEMMLRTCSEHGFDAIQSDALAYLRAQPDASATLISAFHLVEHIPFETLQALVDQCLRVLEPGGLVILETPNPENLSVASTNFFLDPTHIRPLPPPLLAFVAEYNGFEPVQVLRLQEPVELHRTASPHLIDVFTGVSPDYAVLAQRPGNATAVASLESLFARESGLSLSQLATQFEATQARLADEGAQRLVEPVDQRTQNLDQRTQNLDQRTQNLDQRTQNLELQFPQIDQRLQLAERHAQRVEELTRELIAVYSSRSWRITEPLRRVSTKVRHRIAPTLTNKLLKPLARFILNRPKLAAPTRWVLRRIPYGMRLARRVTYAGSASQTLAGLSSDPEKILPGFDAALASAQAPLSVDELLSRVRRELEASRSESHT